MRKKGQTTAIKRSPPILQYLQRDWQLYLLLIPVMLYYIVYQYLPMGGLVMSFQNYIPALGFFDSQWVGFDNFIRFFESYSFWRVLINTIEVSVLQLIFGFPFPVILALLLNEVRNKYFKRTVQTITYAPHFISTVVLVGMMTLVLSPSTGIVNKLIESLGGESINFMTEPGWFKPLYVISDIWQNAGWGAIIYVAALSSVDPQLHESAVIDGANRWQRIWHINLPGILPTIIIMLIMQTGRVMNIGFEKVFLMQTDPNLVASDVISTFVYRNGLIQGQLSFAAAVGMFNSVINFILVFVVNKISSKLSDISLW
jgi:putative aldouronate transport system permease protein